jgi:hypothetical protein
MMVPIPTDPEAQRELVKAARDYADSLVKGPLKEFGGLLGDQLGHWRQMNQVRFLFKAKKYMEEKGVDPKKLLPDVFVPLIEEAGNTEDETLSDVFARLMAAHLDEKDDEKVHPSYTKIAGQISPLDFRILQIIDAREREQLELEQQYIKEHRWGEPLPPLATPDEIEIELTHQGHNVTPGKIDRSLENLHRLRLIRGSTADTLLRTRFWLKLTMLGGRFLEAGSDPTARWRASQQQYSASFLADSPERSVDELRGQIETLRQDMPNLVVAQ